MKFQRLKKVSIVLAIIGIILIGFLMSGNLLQTIVFHECPKSGYITVFDKGQLANQMSEYATLYSHSKRLGGQPVISTSMRATLDLHFSNISFPAMRTDCLWTWDVLPLEKVYELTPNDLQSKNIFINWYVFDVEAFNFYRYQLLYEEFKIRTDVKQNAVEALCKATKQFKISLGNEPKIIYISVHVRRNDYKEWMKSVGGFVASKLYFDAAMSTFREKFDAKDTKTFFVMASDDDEWIFKMFSNETDVFFTSSVSKELQIQQPTFDLAIMSLCNHSIFSMGTFGFWSAYIKGTGDVIYATGTSKSFPYVEFEVRKAMKKWTSLKDPCYEKNVQGEIFPLQKCAGLL